MELPLLAESSEKKRVTVNYRICVVLMIPHKLSMINQRRIQSFPEKGGGRNQPIIPPNFLKTA